MLSFFLKMDLFQNGIVKFKNKKISLEELISKFAFEKLIICNKQR